MVLLEEGVGTEAGTKTVAGFDQRLEAGRPVVLGLVGGRVCSGFACGFRYQSRNDQDDC